MGWEGITILLAFLAVVATAEVYIESVAASLDSPTKVGTGVEKQHVESIPLVAFQCGYRNMQTNKDGQWVPSTSTDAKCLTSKMDILDYCRKVYADKTVSNVVEYSHMVNIGDWCKDDDGTTCKWQFTVRPYRCIVGEFHNEALAVPSGCTFGHLDSSNTCEEFDYWQRQAEDECGRHIGEDKRTKRVRSFAVMQPCGVGKFLSVEFICCPQSQSLIVEKAELIAKPAVDKHQIEESVFDKDLKKGDFIGKTPVKIDKAWEKDFQDADEYRDDDDEDKDGLDSLSKEDDDLAYDNPKEADEIIKAEIKAELSKNTTTTMKPAASITTNAVPVPSAESEASINDDPYFRLADPENEHQLYQEAVERLEKKHHQQVVKVMKEWAEAENKYTKMRETDAKAADAYKEQTKENFHKTVNALDAEIADQRAQIDEVHQERVQSRLNTRKREAIRQYRDALADAITNPQPHDILGKLEAYIRAEEKDRIHQLNRQHNLLRSDEARAMQEKPNLMRSLKDIDLRINGTLAMLHDFPELEKKIRPEALAFWADFRRENTPHTSDATAVSLGAVNKDDRLMQIYESKVRDERVDDVSSAVESDFDQEPAQLTPELVRELKMVPGIEPVLTVAQQTGSASSQDGRMLVEHSGFASQYTMEEDSLPERHQRSILFGAGVCALLVALVAAIFMRRRASRRGFIEVDLYTPEERQLASMQQSGYENPTYTYFEKA